MCGICGEWMCMICVVYECVWCVNVCDMCGVWICVICGGVNVCDIWCANECDMWWCECVWYAVVWMYVIFGVWMYVIFGVWMSVMCGVSVSLSLTDLIQSFIVSLHYLSSRGLLTYLSSGSGNILSVLYTKQGAISLPFCRVWQHTVLPTVRLNTTGGCLFTETSLECFLPLCRRTKNKHFFPMGF